VGVFFISSVEMTIASLVIVVFNMLRLCLIYTLVVASTA